MRRLVVNASVAVNWFLQGQREHCDYAREVRAKIPDAELVSVPGHWTLEVMNALWLPSGTNKSLRLR